MTCGSKRRLHHLATSWGASVASTCDPVGNRPTKTDFLGNATYMYDAADRLVEATTPCRLRPGGVHLRPHGHPPRLHPQRGLHLPRGPSAPGGRGLHVPDTRTAASPAKQPRQTARSPPPPMTPSTTWCRWSCPPTRRCATRTTRWDAGEQRPSAGALPRRGRRTSTTRRISCSNVRRPGPSPPAIPTVPASTSRCSWRRRAVVRLSRGWPGLDRRPH